MGYENERTTVLDLGFRQYETTDEMLADWGVLAGTPTLGIDPPSSVHPQRYMQFAGVSSSVGAFYTLATLIVDLPAPHTRDHEVSLWVQIDAGLAGSQVRVTETTGPSSRTFDMPSDGSWVEVGHTYDPGATHPLMTQLNVELVNVVGSGTFRFSRALIRKMSNYEPSDVLANSVVLPFMTDMDAQHSLAITWVTDVLQGYNSGEIRTQRREAPRMSLKVDFLLDSEEEAALIESLLFGSAGKSFLIPYWPDALWLNTLAPSGSGVLSIDSQGMRSRLFSSNGVAMVWESPFKYDAVTIRDFDDLLLDETLAYDWPASSVVVPMLFGVLSPTAPLTLPTPEMRRFSATFDIVRGNVPLYSIGSGGFPDVDTGDPPPTVETCLQIWDEGFDQADLATFEALYTINHFKNPSGGTYPTASVTVAGSKLTLNGVGDIGTSGLNYYGIMFQKAISPIANLWLKVDFDIEGGTWDAFNSNIFITPEHWTGTPMTIFAESDFIGGEVLQLTQAGGNTSPFDFDTRLYGNDTDGENDVSTGTSKLLPAGSYSFVIWCGELTGVTQRMELWINPSPGDAADATNDVTKVAGEKFSTLRIFPLAPESIGKAVSVTHVEAWRGPRSCDPFGIL